MRQVVPLIISILCFSCAHKPKVHYKRLMNGLLVGSSVKVRGSKYTGKRIFVNDKSKAIFVVNIFFYKSV